MSRCIMITHTRKIVNPLDLRAEDIDLQDIAHHLAILNRFNGASDFPIPIAQHCVYVSRLCERFGLEAAWQGLLHDGSEAYFGDMTKWLKHSPEMKPYRDAETRAQQLIYTVFGLPEEDLLCVKAADDLMVRWEAQEGFGGDFHFDDPIKYPPINAQEKEWLRHWHPVRWRIAKTMFLEQAQRLANWKMRTEVKAVR